MTENEQIKAAKEFAAKWLGRGDEKSHTQEFWITLLSEIFGVDNPFDRIKFEQNLAGHPIDAIIPSSKVLIEQKSFSINLDQKYSQSDGESLTPYEQAKRYYDELKYSERPRWIIVCNFAEFHIYDMYPDNIFKNDLSPTIIKLENLAQDFRQLKFISDPNADSVKPEVKVSKDAADLIAKIRNSLKDNYEKNKQHNYQSSLAILCVRLVFCFYAVDSKLIKLPDNDKNIFRYIKNFADLQNIFAVMNLPDHANLSDPNLNRFPYVNGGLFKDKISMSTYNPNVNPIDLAKFLDQTRAFKWHNIHPAVFGAIFESVLNDNFRRAAGMHYTSIDNIHKVIDHLFLDELYEDFKKARKARKDKPAKLRAFQQKLASIIVFDPACGSGNFLTETYISLRRLENLVIRELYNDNSDLFENPVKVSINQFFGVEIDPFAASVAQLALYIAENQMLRQIIGILDVDLPQLPLKNYSQIHCANALQIDWNSVVPRDKLTFIIGNPPFIGYTYQSAQQKADLLAVTGLNFKKMDYVVSWYYKAAAFISGTDIRCAFVSTNSICQGEQVAAVWKNIFAQGIHFDFAYKTFKWTSDSDKMAAVHCVIIGFSQNYRGDKFIFDGDKKIPAKNINAYLVDAPNVFVESRTQALCNVPDMVYGNKPAEGGNLIIEANYYDYFTLREPRAKKFIKQLVGAEEFINGKKRWCLWIVDCPREEISKMPMVAERVEAVRQFRLKSKKAATREDANRPTEFQENRQPSTNYILVPRVSSENRRYIPIGFMPPEVIASDAVQIIPDATVYHFGVLTSGVHMAWTRLVCGRLEMRYRYSKDIVYNNFPWCRAGAAERAAIEAAAEKILAVRAEYEGWTLAQLYDEKTMPEKLRAAHKENDAAVMAAYGFAPDMSEEEIVARLLEMYQELAR